MTNKEFVIDNYPHAAAGRGIRPDSGYVINSTDYQFLDYQTEAATEDESWTICAHLIRRYMLEKLEY